LQSWGDKPSLLASKIACSFKIRYSGLKKTHSLRMVCGTQLNSALPASVRLYAEQLLIDR